RPGARHRRACDLRRLHGTLDGTALDRFRARARVGTAARLVRPPCSRARAAQPRVRRLVRPGRTRPRAILLVMATDSHSLVAPYALDALDEGEEREFEDHLAHCERCREELTGLREAAAALAFATPPTTPPPELQQRILEQARSERPNVVPLHRRRRWAATF